MTFCIRIVCKNRDLMRRLAKLTPDPTDTAAIVVWPTPAGLAALDAYRRDALRLLAIAIERQGGSSAMN